MHCGHCIFKDLGNLDNFDGIVMLHLLFLLYLAFYAIAFVCLIKIIPVTWIMRNNIVIHVYIMHVLSNSSELIHLSHVL